MWGVLADILVLTQRNEAHAVTNSRGRKPFSDGFAAAIGLDNDVDDGEVVEIAGSDELDVTIAPFYCSEDQK